jgi:hypothetical protein
MKTLKPTGKLKSKKTIRRMTPMARKLAHLTRSAQSVVTRLKFLTDELQRLEMERAAFERQAEHMLHTWTPPKDLTPMSHLWPELPNGEGIAHACICGHGIHEHNNGRGWCHLSDCDCGHFKEGIAGEASEGIGGEGAGYHSGSAADPRD